MKVVLRRWRDGRVTVEDMPAPRLAPGFVLVRNRCSLISAGTERASLEAGREGVLSRARRNPEQIKRVLKMSMELGPRRTYEVVQEKLNGAGVMGYSCAGSILSVGEGVNDVRRGDRVAVAGAGYANHAEVVAVPRNLCVTLPPQVPFDSGAFVTVGAIALHAIHQAGVEPGSRVVVIGLGLVGQLAVRLLHAYEFETVGVDLEGSMLDLARAADIACYARGQRDLEEEITRHWDGPADAVIVAAASSSSDPVDLAGRLSRDRGTVVVLGDVAVEPVRSTYYGKELSIRYSRSYGPGRYDPLYEEGGIDYPIGFVPWTERRNMEEFVRLLGNGRVDLAGLQPMTFSIADAPRAYEALEATGDQRRVAILLSYDVSSPSGDVVPLASEAEGKRPRKSRGDPVRVSAVGAGSFASELLFPELSRRAHVQFAWLATNSGVTAVLRGRRWRFETAVGSIEEGIELGATDCVMVLSSHASHGRYAASVLASGVGLFCEKPLALTEDELDAVAEAWLARGAPAMVGFNRRFAPAIQDLQKVLEGRGPMQVTYRIFAPKPPAGHWYYDPAQGGRILGEVCHFVDTAGYLVGSRPLSVTAFSADGGREPRTADSVSALIEYGNGSSAAITYCGAAPNSAPKEQLEIACDGLAARLDNFTSLETWGREHRTDTYRGGPKGHREEMGALVHLLRGEPDPVGDFRLSLWSTLATLRLCDSLATSQRLSVAPETISLAAALGVESSLDVPPDRPEGSAHFRDAGSSLT